MEIVNLTPFEQRYLYLLRSAAAIRLVAEQTPFSQFRASCDEAVESIRRARDTLRMLAMSEDSPIDDKRVEEALKTFSDEWSKSDA